MVARCRRHFVDLLRGDLAFRNSESHARTRYMKRFSPLRVTTDQWEFTVAILLTLVLMAVHVVFLFHAGPLWRDEISSRSDHL